MKNEKIIREIVNTDTLAAYLVAFSSERCGVYANGTWAVSDGVGNEIAKDENPIVWVKCPGIGNLDMGYWAEGYATPREDGLWDTEDGILDDQALIRNCCEDGEVSEELESLRDNLINALWAFEEMEAAQRP